jgi:hypothetical protein
MARQPISNNSGVADSRVLALVHDDRLFRAELVSSVLKLFNAVYLTKSPGARNHDASAQPLAWVRDVNARRAELGGFPVDPRTTWTLEEEDPANAIQPRRAGEPPAPIQWLAQFFHGTIPEPGRVTVRDIIENRDDSPESVQMRTHRAQWLNSVLDATNIWTKHHFRDDAIQEVSLIQLNTVERCVAYAIMWLIQNKDGLLDRIRVCPFTGRDIASPHYWLDFRVELDGKMARGTPKIYCSKRHEGAASARRRREKAHE